MLARRLLLGITHVVAAVIVSHASLAATATAFDIAAQPLGPAIDAFCEATGTEVYYDGAAAMGRRSAAVTGTLTRDEALRHLLVDTDLVALRVRDNSYLLINPGDDAARAAAAALLVRDRDYQRYFAVLQGDIQRILCRDAHLFPGPHRVVIRLWVGPSGQVQRAELAESTGDQSREQMLLAMLIRARLTEPAPAHMRQPVTLAIWPGALASAPCVSSNPGMAGR
jgi:hypothetical protein